jgi:hypothetical protein
MAEREAGPVAVESPLALHRGHLGPKSSTAAFADSQAAIQQTLVVADCCSAKNGAVSRLVAPTLLLVLKLDSDAAATALRS